MRIKNTLSLGNIILLMRNKSKENTIDNYENKTSQVF